MKLGYSTYVFGKNALISQALPKFGIAEKKSMKKLTVEQQIKQLNETIADKDATIALLHTRQHDQNVLMERVRAEGNQLIDKYNKLAGKVNAIRSLVTNND